MSGNVIDFPADAGRMLGDLSRFNGTEVWYQDFASRTVYSEGVKYVVDKAQAYWLIDSIVLNQTIRASVLATQTFQVWKLVVSDKASMLICEDGDGLELHRGGVTTDFPKPSVTFWFVDGRIFLPSEY